jgi:hypothetical protein
MRTPWFGSFAQELAVSVAKATTGAACFLLIAGLVAGGAVARAQEPKKKTAAAESKEAKDGKDQDSGLDPHFLDLSAFSLEYATQPPEQVRVGEPLQFRIAGLESGSIKLELPQGEKPLAEYGFSQPSPLGFVPLKAGQLTIPSMVVRDVDRVVGRTNPFQLSVASAIKSDDPKPNEPAGFRPPVRLKFPLWMVIAMSVGALALLGMAGYFAFRWYQKRKAARLAAKKPEPPKPEDEVALAALAALEKQNLCKNGLHKKHYFGISEILKRYIGSRYRFDASESTTYEMMQVLEGSRGLAPELLDRIEALFQRLDRVKFTDHVPEEREGRAVIEDARSLVLTTKRPVAILNASNSPGPSLQSKEVSP